MYCRCVALRMQSIAIVCLLPTLLTTAAAYDLHRRPSSYTPGVHLPSASAISTSHLRTIYDRFIENYYINATGIDAARIKWGTGQNTTLKSGTPVARATSSEGLGLAMLMTAYAKDRARFDRLFAFYRAVPRKIRANRLMPWLVFANRSPVTAQICSSSKCRLARGRDPKPIGDIYVSMALLVADAQWGNYKHHAVNLINFITFRRMYVGNCESKSILAIKPRRQWLQECKSEISPWYYQPAFFSYFATVEGVKRKDFWKRLAENAYDVFDMKKVNNKTFVPDLLRLSSTSDAPTSHFSYDSARIPLSVALDYAWHRTPRAKNFAEELVTDLVLKSNDLTIDGIQGPISRITGNSLPGNPRSFQGGFASAAAVAFDQGKSNEFATAFLESALSNDYPWRIKSSGGYGDRDNDSYGMAMSVLSALFLTGNFEHPDILKKRDRNGKEICKSRDFGFLVSHVKIANSQSIAAMLNKQPKGKKGETQLKILTKNFETIDDHIQEWNTRAEDRRDCEVRPRTEDNARKFVQYCGWGKLKNQMCVTKFDIAEPEFEPKKLFDTMSSLTRLLNDSAVNKPLQGSFAKSKAVFATGMYHHQSRYRHCQLAASTGYRIRRGHWVTWLAFTNAPVKAQMAPKKRLLLSEGLYFHNGAIHAEPIQLPVCDKKKLLHMINGTTLRSEGGGKHDWSEFSTSSIDENPAVKAALENGEHEMQLALDSSTASNIAILALPVLLAAVPLALFADVSGTITLAYAVVTDVVSVLPLLIKGIEMIVVGRRETYAARALVYGAQDASDLGVTEAWVAKCRMHNSVSRNGAILVGLAVTGMLFGILLEVVARRQVKKNKLRERRAKDRDQVDRMSMSPFDDNWETQFGKKRVVRAEAAPPAIRGGLLWDLARRRATEEEKLLADKFSNY